MLLGCKTTNKQIQAFFSPTAIKTGRYTHEKKTRDIEEVKRLQSRAATINKGRGLPETTQREAELERIIKHITAAHLAQTPHSPEFFQKLPEKEAEYLVCKAVAFSDSLFFLLLLFFYQKPWPNRGNVGEFGSRSSQTNDLYN